MFSHLCISVLEDLLVVLSVAIFLVHVHFSLSVCSVSQKITSPLRKIRPLSTFPSSNAPFVMFLCCYKCVREGERFKIEREREREREKHRERDSKTETETERETHTHR